MAQKYKQVELFGGAMVVNLPSSFTDVSTIRQVPDNQEVYLDASGFSSLTFDLTEHQSQFSTDNEALEYHFADIVAEGDSKNIWSVNESVELPKFPSNTPALSLVATTALPAMSISSRPNTPTHTNMMFTLIRLVEQGTDFVITLNVPHVPDPGNKREQTGQDLVSERQRAVKMMEEICREVLGKLEVKDWGLFDA